VAVRAGAARIGRLDSLPPVNFDLSDDQVALRDGARDLLDDLASPPQVRAVVDGGGGVDGELWSAMSAQGWPLVALGEEQGGLGLGAVEVTVLLEEIGRHAAPAPVASTVLALDALTAGGATELVERLAGGAIGCVAWSRRRDALRVSERPDVRLTGRADPVPYAPSAAVAVIVAQSEAGPGLYAVDLDEVGRPPREPAMDRTRETGWLDLDATPAIRLGGADAVDRLLEHGAVYSCAEMLGGAARVLDLAVEYAKDRVQFDRPIGSFQAVKHRCADMLVDVEGMRSTTYWAAWCLAAGDPEGAVAASTAKIWCGDASKRVMASALQVHGGIGFTWEHDLHLFLKRAQLDQLAFGDSSFHRERLAALLRPRITEGVSVI
jgi:alkylation response protein AidB-like acyl-CoA dehydrogenase